MRCLSDNCYADDVGIKIWDFPRLEEWFNLGSLGQSGGHTDMHTQVWGHSLVPEPKFKRLRTWRWINGCNVEKVTLPGWIEGAVLYVGSSESNTGALGRPLTSLGWGRGNAIV